MAQAEETPRNSRAAELAEARAAARVERTGGEWAIRALNVAVASILLLVTLPVWILIAIAVKLTSRGPVFYRQVRVGRDSRYRQDR
ncbi:MAG: sugar transferase, partial [Gemmatimonadales bacterium]